MKTIKTKSVSIVTKYVANMLSEVLWSDETIAD